MYRWISLTFFSLLLGTYAEINANSITIQCEQSLNKNPAFTYALKVLENPKHLRLSKKGTLEAAKRIADSKYNFRAPSWNQFPYPDNQLSFNESFKYFVLLSSINFMYWSPETGDTFSSNDLIGAGYLASIITENWSFFSNPENLQSIETKDIENLFPSKSPLPLPELRARNLREVGQFFETFKNRDWLTWLRRQEGPIDAVLFLKEQMPESFSDIFLKRSQLAIGQIITRYRDTPDIIFKDSFTSAGVGEGMTVYADYILPMVLIKLGIIELSAKLMNKIQKGEILEKDSQEEKELRAATIIGSQMLLIELRKFKQYKNLTILDIDAGLWLQGKEIIFPGSLMPNLIFVLKEFNSHPKVIGDNY